MNYRGRCPICSGQLLFNGALVSCEKGDYAAPVSQFEGRWEEYDSKTLEMTEKLLEDLKSYNTKGVKE